MSNENFETIIDSDGKSHQILKDKGRTRVPVLLRDAASFCMDCMGKGVWDVGIRCPTCGGSGMLNREGQGVDEVVRATSNKTEGARQGEFGVDRALINDAIARDSAWRAATAGSRPGFRIDSSPEGKAARAKVFDAMAQYDKEREAAWRTLDSEYTGASSEFNVGAGSEARRVGGEQREGDVCMAEPDKVPGHLKRDGNGDLRCVPDRAGSEGRRTLDQVARDHQTHMQNEYDQYSRRQSEAYRTLK